MYLSIYLKRKVQICIQWFDSRHGAVVIHRRLSDVVWAWSIHLTNASQLTHNSKSEQNQPWTANITFYDFQFQMELPPLMRCQEKRAIDMKSLQLDSGNKLSILLRLWVNWKQSIASFHETSVIRGLFLNSALPLAVAKRCLADNAATEEGQKKYTAARCLAVIPD